MKYKTPEINEFVFHSNLIEGVEGKEAFDDHKRAWRFLEKKKQLTLGDVLAAHFILMKRLDPSIAGQLRNHAVRIGWRICKFVSVQLLEDELRYILNKVNTYETDLTRPIEERELLAKRMHVAYERWHGFPDGNGRTGRLVWQWHRWKLGLPMHIVHAGGEDHRNYYKWFNDENL